MVQCIEGLTLLILIICIYVQLESAFEVLLNQPLIALSPDLDSSPPSYLKSNKQPPQVGRSKAPPLKSLWGHDVGITLLLDGISEAASNSSSSDRTDVNVLISNPLLLLVKRFMPQLPE